MGLCQYVTFAFMHPPYLVCILFGMPSLHLFTFLMFLFLVLYTCQDITMACNESSDCSTATDLLNFVRSIITVSKLCLHFAHLRFSKPSSSFNVISNRALILDASLSWLAFFTKQCYSMVAISHRGSTKAAHRCHFR